MNERLLFCRVGPVRLSRISKSPSSFSTDRRVHPSHIPKQTQRNQQSLTAKLPRTEGPPTREKETEGADDGAVRVLRGGADGEEGATGGGRPPRGAGGPRQGRRGRPEETAGIRKVSCWTSSTSTDKGYEGVKDIKPRRASSEVADGVKASYVSNCIL